MKKTLKFKEMEISIKASDDTYDAEPRFFFKKITPQNISTLAQDAQPEVEMGDYYTELTHGSPLYLHITFYGDDGMDLFGIEIHDIPCPCDMQSQLENLQTILEGCVDGDEINLENLEKLSKNKKFTSAGDFDMELWNSLKTTGKVSKKITSTKAEDEIRNAMSRIIAENSALQDSDHVKVECAVYGFWKWIKENQKIVKKALSKDKTDK